MSRAYPFPRGFAAPLILGFALVGWFASLTAQAQVSPAESAQKLKPAEGLKATLFASEPMVNNPTGIDVDSRGRVWVAEGQNYRMTHRKELPRIEGADRIKILEDTDGDGKADKVTIFADNIFPIPMGLAVEERYDKDGKYVGAKVYIGNSPDLLVLEDTDGDDKADKRSALLTGFGGVDSDHGVHGMTLGLDGRLYFTHGDGCCSFEAKDNSHAARNFDVTDASGRHVTSSNLANTLRVDRDGKNFEILADRQRNNYETSLNAHGVAFTSDNDDDGNRGSRVIWVMDGGNYGYRTPGSPRHWGEEVPGIVPKMVGTGNGSPSGITVYEGSLLGPKYVGSLFEADAGTRQINFFPIERHDATYRTKYEVLLSSDDPWFRPVDVTAAPDGSVLVADWYDAAVGGHSFRDQDTGRIYRVAPKGSSWTKPKPDFATVPGLISLLKSPVVAAQDAARRSLIARGDEAEVKGDLKDLFEQGSPIERARALWVRRQIEGDSVAVAALTDKDPAIREQAVRMLGRDLSRVGAVVFSKESPRKAPVAQQHIKDLLPLANDPDAGVRRELILAFRWLATGEVGEALGTLVKGWDGQDRWYLEALGLALGDRESTFLADLFNNGPFGPIGGSVERDGANGDVAVPPFFPADRNESYVAAGTPDQPATPLSKLIGLAWRLHRPEVLPAFRRVLPSLAAPTLQQAADDALSQVNDKEAASIMAEVATTTTDPGRRAALTSTIAGKLAGSWRDAKGDAPVVALIQTSLANPATRVGGIELTVAAYDARYGPALMKFAQDEKETEEVRVAAIEAIGRIRPPKTAEVLDALIAAAIAKGQSTPLAQAAIRALPDVRPSNPALLAWISATDTPLGLRREALRVYARPKNGGGRRIIELVKSEKLPDELRSEATALVHNDTDWGVRQEANTLLPAPKTASGRTLPPIRELAARDGDPTRGHAVFFAEAKNASAVACGSCHRVQGQGRWVGPDLSTIGTKYGKEELIRSILYPSAAIGYNNKTHVLATTDGRVLTGLVVEESPDRIILKTAEGKRETVPSKDVEDHKISEVSLMPEGLAGFLSDRDFSDLIAYLTTLRQPVSIVGQYQAVGPVTLAEGSALPSPKTPLPTPSGGQPLAWRRLLSDAEGRADITALVGSDNQTAAFLHVPMLVPGDFDAQLVIDTPGVVRAYLDGKEVKLASPNATTPRTAHVRLSIGEHDLILRVEGGNSSAGAVTTIVAPQPVEFRSGDTPSVSAQ